jgi:hypothetical protein
MVYLFHALAGCVDGGRIPTATKTCASCRDLFILAAALGVERRHTSKKRSTHYKPLVNHAASAYTSPIMAVAGLASLNA